MNIDVWDCKKKTLDPENKNYGKVINKEFSITYSGDYQKLKESKDSKIDIPESLNFYVVSKDKQN